MRRTIPLIFILLAYLLIIKKFVFAGNYWVPTGPCKYEGPVCFGLPAQQTGCLGEVSCGPNQKVYHEVTWDGIETGSFRCQDDGSCTGGGSPNETPVPQQPTPTVRPQPTSTNPPNVGTPTPLSTAIPVTPSPTPIPIVIPVMGIKIGPLPSGENVAALVFKWNDLFPASIYSQETQYQQYMEQSDNKSRPQRDEQKNIFQSIFSTILSIFY